MKEIAMIVASILCVTHVDSASSAVAVSSLPASEFADTEVSTNIPIVVNFDRMDRMDFTLSLVPSPSNCVEVAVGADANGDGSLSVYEADCVFGCDCGRWFRCDALNDHDEIEDQGRDSCGAVARVERVFVLNRKRLRTDWNLVKVTRRGFGETDECVEIRERSMGFKVILK